MLVIIGLVPSIVHQSPGTPGARGPCASSISARRSLTRSPASSRSSTRRCSSPSVTYAPAIMRRPWGVGVDLVGLAERVVEPGAVIGRHRSPLRCLPAPGRPCVARVVDSCGAGTQAAPAAYGEKGTGRPLSTVHQSPGAATIARTGSGAFAAGCCPLPSSAPSVAACRGCARSPAGASPTSRRRARPWPSCPGSRPAAPPCSPAGSWPACPSLSSRSPAR